MLGDLAKIWRLSDLDALQRTNPVLSEYLKSVCYYHGNNLLYRAGVYTWHLLGAFDTGYEFWHIRTLLLAGHISSYELWMHRQISYLLMYDFDFYEVRDVVGVIWEARYGLGNVDTAAN